MRRRGSASIVANPVLVGAVTTLVVIVAVFLSYNANNGLPFVPTHQLFVELKNGSEIVKGNEIREGGFRVGVVEDMTPAMLENGHVGAKLKLKLDKKVGQLPVDTTFTVRQRGSLGLKYLQLDKGHAKQKLKDGSTIPLRHTLTPVDLDRVYDMFDNKTRQAAADDLVGYGNAFAARGPSLHDFIDRAPRLFGVLRPVASNLADNRTDLAGFFQALERTEFVEVDDPQEPADAGCLDAFAEGADPVFGGLGEVRARPQQRGAGVASDAAGAQQRAGDRHAGAEALGGAQ